MLRTVVKVVAGLLLLLVIATGAVHFLGGRRVASTWDVPAASITTSTDSATLARGEHVAKIRGCVDCHSPGLEGRLVADAMPVMHVTASNLTGGQNGVASEYRTDEDWVRAIRSGVAPDGSALLLMPSQEYRVIGPDDLGALVSWIKSLPPVDSEPVSQSVGLVGRALILLGQLPLISAELIDHTDTEFGQPAEGVTIEFGAYIAASCTGCHGQDFTGGPIPGMPPGSPLAANLTPDVATGIGAWTEEDFVRLAETGVRPDGRQFDPIDMPWPALQAMTDEERSAVWTFLRSLPPTRTDAR